MCINVKSLPLNPVEFVHNIFLKYSHQTLFFEAKKQRKGIRDHKSKQIDSTMTRVT